MTTAIRTDLITDSTLDEDHICITFKWNGELWTLVGLPSANDYFICHRTGKHIKFGSHEFEELTDFFNRHELWDVPQ
jgi:hypothetical protein